MIKIIATAGEEDLQKLDSIDTKDIDILEIRLDLISKKFIRGSLIEYLRRWNKPLLFTYRLKEDSSEKKHTSVKYDYISTILEMYNRKENYLDIDLSKKNSIFNDLNNNKFTKIYSYHDFNGYPNLITMKNYIESIQISANDKNNIFKFAVLPASLEEDIQFLENSKQLALEYKLALIIMGERGIYSRIFGDMYGSILTYACLNEPRAPGQIKAKDIRKFRTLCGLKN